MNSFKNSNQGRRMREWKQVKPAQTDKYRVTHHEYTFPRDEYENLSRQYDWVNSPAYQAARHKAIKDRFHAYIIVGCAILVIAILMFWP